MTTSTKETPQGVMRKQPPQKMDAKMEQSAGDGPEKEALPTSPNDGPPSASLEVVNALALGNDCTSKSKTKILQNVWPNDLLDE